MRQTGEWGGMGCSKDSRGHCVALGAKGASPTGLVQSWWQELYLVQPAETLSDDPRLPWSTLPNLPCSDTQLGSCARRDLTRGYLWAAVIAWVNMHTGAGEISTRPGCYATVHATRDPLECSGIGPEGFGEGIWDLQSTDSWEPEG